MQNHDLEDTMPLPVPAQVDACIGTSHINLQLVPADDHDQVLLIKLLRGYNTAKAAKLYFN